MGVANDERRALCDLFEQVGPDVPTLCAGWQTRDLAAHLAVRDRRPDAAPGIMIPAFAGHTQRVQDTFAAKPWTELVNLVRTGPPRLSPLAIPALNELVNSAEYFIHHEDVRRGGEEWQPRPADARRDAILWRTVGFSGRMSYKRSPVGVVLRRPDGAEVQLHRGPSTVAIVGEPGELLLHVFGRAAAQVSFDGEAAAIGVVQGLERSF
ncbi:MAG TPA: TIGR03085 family metal-binding protein [Pseudonocardiaceae bacterium]|jgi:uncharacterized protein (TIGR03085 family)|nr:TIGR03085 family metal-binding protein [Pseudonocardiaceae bacterium]